MLDQSVVFFLKNLEAIGFKIYLKPEDNTKFLVESQGLSMLNEELRQKLRDDHAKIIAILNTPKKATLKNFMVEGVFIKHPNDVSKIFKTIKQQEWIAIDYETTGLNAREARIRLAQFYDSINKKAYCFDLYVPGMKEALTKELKDLENFRLVAANAGFEAAFTMIHLEVNKIIFCIQALERYVRSSELNVNFRYALDDLALRYLKVNVDKTLQTSNWNSDVLSDQQIEYALLDSVLTYEIFIRQLKILGDSWLESKAGSNFKVLCSCLKTYTLSSFKGIRVNQQEIERSVDVRRTEVDSIAKQILEETGLSYSTKTKYPIKETEFKKYLELKYPSFVKVLEEGSLDADKMIKNIISSNVKIPEIMFLWSKYKRAIKQHSDARSYLQQIKNGRISYGAAVGKQDTGRVSLFKPALNTLSHNTEEWSPRNWIIPEEGEVLLEIDAAQQEAMLLALAINNRSVIEALKAGVDLHKYAASKIYNVPLEKVSKEQRTFGKQANLSLGYAMRSKTFRTKLIQNLKRYFTLGEARELWNGWRNAFPDIVRAHKTVHEQALQDGYVESAGGRRYLSNDINENKAINYKVQPSAADALYLVIKELSESEYAAYMLFSVHDSWIFSCAKAKVEALKAFMLRVYKKALIELFPNIELDFFEKVNLLDYKESEVSWGGGTICAKPLLDSEDYREIFTSCFYEIEKHTDNTLVPGIYPAKISNVLTGDISGKGNTQCVCTALVDCGEEDGVGDVREITFYITYKGPNESFGLQHQSYHKMAEILELEKETNSLKLSQETIKSCLIGKEVMVCCYQRENKDFNNGIDYVFFLKERMIENKEYVEGCTTFYSPLLGGNFKDVMQKWLEVGVKNNLNML